MKRLHHPSNDRGLALGVVMLIIAALSVGAGIYFKSSLTHLKFSFTDSHSRASVVEKVGILQVLRADFTLALQQKLDALRGVAENARPHVIGMVSDAQENIIELHPDMRSGFIRLSGSTGVPARNRSFGDDGMRVEFTLLSRNSRVVEQFPYAIEVNLTSPTEDNSITRISQVWQAAPMRLSNLGIGVLSQRSPLNLMPTIVNGATYLGFAEGTQTAVDGDKPPGAPPGVTQDILVKFMNSSGRLTFNGPLVMAFPYHPELAPGERWGYETGEARGVQFNEGVQYNNVARIHPGDVEVGLQSAAANDGIALVGGQPSSTHEMADSMNDLLQSLGGGSSSPTVDLGDPENLQTVSSFAHDNNLLESFPDLNIQDPDSLTLGDMELEAVGEGPFDIPNLKEGFPFQVYRDNKQEPPQYFLLPVAAAEGGDDGDGGSGGSAAYQIPLTSSEGHAPYTGQSLYEATGMNLTMKSNCSLEARQDYGEIKTLTSADFKNMLTRFADDPTISANTSQYIRTNLNAMAERLSAGYANSFSDLSVDAKDAALNAIQALANKSRRGPQIIQATQNPLVVRLDSGVLNILGDNGPSAFFCSPTTVVANDSINLKASIKRSNNHYSYGSFDDGELRLPTIAVVSTRGNITIPADAASQLPGRTTLTQAMSNPASNETDIGFQVEGSLIASNGKFQLAPQLISTAPTGGSWNLGVLATEGTLLVGELGNFKVSNNQGVNRGFSSFNRSFDPNTKHPSTAYTGANMTLSRLETVVVSSIVKDLPSIQQATVRLGSSAVQGQVTGSD